MSARDLVLLVPSAVALAVVVWIVLTILLSLDPSALVHLRSHA